jgi:short-subunit dehydrogenase
MPTALVTGASSGIGLSFARQLAAKGNDLVVVARDEARLKELANELRVDVEVLPADLTDAEQLLAVERRLADATRPIETLINNAGFGTNGPLADADIATLDREIRLNVLALVRLTHAALPGMLERGGGGILNVSSIAGFQPAAKSAVYSATKAAVTSFSQAVHEEVRSRGVRVSVLCPGFTETEFQTRGGFSRDAVPKAAWQTADQVAATGLKGLARNQALVVPGLPNKLLAASTHLMPRGVVRRVAAMVGGRL